MSTDEQKLIADHQEVVDTIRLYTNINLISTKGDPANEYDIEYRLRGFTIGADNSVKVSKQHRIKIQLPFGYPHFPPTIKPLSPIFHPEIDDYVVPIANYWENNKSLAGLIIHIGNLICGNVSSNDTPINSEAAKYYQKHSDKLPLDSLKPVETEETKEREPIQFNILAPLVRILAVVLAVMLVCGGGLLLYEKTRIDSAERVFAEAQAQFKEQEFIKANQSAKSALPKLKSIVLLRSAKMTLEEDIRGFISSRDLQEGLKGRVKYANKYIEVELVHKIELLNQLFEKALDFQKNGDIDKAIESYEKALDYAQKNSVPQESDQLERNFAQLRLKLLLAESEKAHESKNWEWAIQQHEAVVNFLDQNGKYIPDSANQARKIGYLLMIDRIALYSQRASDAEKQGDLESALHNYTALIDLIGQSNPKNNSTLRVTLVDSMQKSAIITEKLNIQNKRQWLIKNYKEIFQQHYPTIFAATLRNPQAIFVKYDEKNMVFDVSCLEKGSGSVVRLRLFYQYNPDTDAWSPYDKEIEQTEGG